MGVFVGIDVGTAVGVLVGIDVGTYVGVLVGIDVGDVVGTRVGVEVGVNENTIDGGTSVVIALGLVDDGIAVGLLVDGGFDGFDESVEVRVGSEVATWTWHVGVIVGAAVSQ